MNTTLQTMVVLACLNGPAVLPELLAADPPPPLRPPAPETVIPVPPTPPEPPIRPRRPASGFIPDLDPILADVTRQVESGLAQAGVAWKDIASAMPNMFGGGGGGRGANQPGRTLVIPGAATDPAATATAEEDLNVMARILEKALISGEHDNDERRAMGIAISMVGPPSGAPRNLYLDGYGAVFFLDVAFPLLPPPSKDEEATNRQTVSSDWEEARRELEVGRSGEPRLPPGAKYSSRTAGKYDADRVEQLKDAVLASLKNVSHIRDLKPEESVTIVISGGSAALSERNVTRRTSDARGHRTTVESRVVTQDASRAPGARGETTMMIRVKKTEAEDFAKGTLTMDKFRNRAVVRVY